MDNDNRVLCHRLCPEWMKCDDACIFDVEIFKMRKSPDSFMAIVLLIYGMIFASIIIFLSGNTKLASCCKIPDEVALQVISDAKYVSEFDVSLSPMS